MKRDEYDLSLKSRKYLRKITITVERMNKILTGNVVKILYGRKALFFLFAPTNSLGNLQIRYM